MRMRWCLCGPSLLVWGILLFVRPTSPVQAQALLYSGRVQGGVATDSSGVSPTTFDSTFYRGPDLELRVPAGATLTRAWLAVNGGPNGLPGSSSLDTLDLIRLEGQTLREVNASLEREVRNEQDRRLLKIFDVTSFFQRFSPSSSDVITLRLEEQGRADTADRSSTGTLGEQLIVLYEHPTSPPRDVEILFGYARPPATWSFKDLALAEEGIAGTALLSTTLVWNNACDQNGILAIREPTASGGSSFRTLTETAGGRDDGVLTVNQTCSPKNEDTNSLITSGSFGGSDEWIVGADGDAFDREPGGSRYDSRQSDELFGLSYAGTGALELSFSKNEKADTSGDTSSELNAGYLSMAILMVELTDTDRDGVIDPDDLCPYVPDAQQADMDRDGSGDLCDLCTDLDGDGFAHPDYASYGVCAADCDDLTSSINPAGIEIPYNDIDEDCSGSDLNDQDFDGYRPEQGDCDDLDPDRHPGRFEVCDGIDQDCSGIPDDPYDQDGDTYLSMASCGALGEDCDDLNPDISPAELERCDQRDNNCDGRVDEGLLSCDTADEDEDGYRLLDGDCDDLDATRHPGSLEICDRIDQNCNGLVDETFDRDRDASLSQAECGPVGLDCDDARADVFPGAPERCDGLDNNCDGRIDEDLPPDCLSADQDGDGQTAGDGDCNDADSEVLQGAQEICDGLDNDCTGRADEPFDQDEDSVLDATACGALGADCNDVDSTSFPGAAELCDGRDNDCDGRTDEDFDRDQDGALSQSACPENGTDCDDRDAARAPGSEERCNGLDDDCDGQLDPEETDLDGDGFATCAGDCNDADPASNPTASEVCDGTDNDCDGGIDEGFDLDQDGFLDASFCSGSAVDCNDARSDIYPGAEERCDGVDEDCSGSVDEPFDLDQDSYYDATRCPLGSDCDDASADIYPGRSELCDARDNDCDGRLDEDIPGGCETADSDGDGFTFLQGDCDDADSAVYPGGDESCDGIDQDCDGQADEPFDADHDGFMSSRACPLGDDCNDLAATVYPGAPELCDNLDNDCDGARDEELPQNCAILDLDGDGFTPLLGDCDDTNPEISPTSEEVCDARDQDCNGVVDDPFDADLDGFFDATLCFYGDDCDESDPLVNPGASERCNLLDDTCNGIIDEGLAEDCYSLDSDGDGFSPGTGDCDDDNVMISPAIPEICDGIDQNCDGYSDESFDLDQDGVLDQETCPDGEDCDDQNASVYPGAIEKCDGIDNDCDIAIDETFDIACLIIRLDSDSDEDGFSTLEGDCDNRDPAIYPGATERCNGLDDNCNRSVDEGLDADGDGAYSLQLCPELSDGDCDDDDPDLHPGQTERCDDGLDNDCDGRIDDPQTCPTPTPPPIPEVRLTGGGLFCSYSTETTELVGMDAVPPQQAPGRPAFLLLLLAMLVRLRVRAREGLGGRVRERSAK